jgi:hypothetical protein
MSALAFSAASMADFFATEALASASALASSARFTAVALAAPVFV